jgi:hypothetical protein
VTSSARPTPGGGGAGPWWAWILAVDVALAGITASGVGPLAWLYHEHAWLLALQRWLDLTAESNLATWWSAVPMVLAAALFWERSGAGPPGDRVPWAILAAFSLGLSVDEIGSVHERVGKLWGWTPLLAIGAVCGGALGWALLGIGRRGGGRVVAPMTIAYALYGSVAIQERLEHHVAWGPWAGLRGGIEEGTELVASLLVLIVATGVRMGPPRTGRGAILPDTARLPCLTALLAAGLVASSATAVWVVPRLPDLDFRGNPAVWYPAVVYGLLAWAALGHPPPRRGAWPLLGIIFAVASIGQVFDLVALLPGIHLVLPRWTFYGLGASYVFLVPPVVALGLGAGLFGRRGPAALGAALVPLAWMWVLPDWRVAAVTPGYLPFVWAAALGVVWPPSAAATSTRASAT